MLNTSAGEARPLPTPSAPRGTARSSRRGPAATLLALALATTAVVAGAPAAPAAAAAPNAPEAAATAPAAAAAVLPSVRATSSDALADAYGVTIHLTYAGTPYKDMALTVQRLRDLGVRHVRTRFYDSPAQWAGLRQLTDAGIRLNLVMGAPKAGNTPAELVALAAKNLPLDMIDSFEGANEYNLSDDPHWVAHVRAHQVALYAAVKADPRTRAVPVLMPSMGLHKDYEKLGDMSRIADLGNDHLYPGGQQPSVKVDGQMAQVRGVVGDKPIVFTETGYHNAMNTRAGHFPTTESTAGVYAPKLLLEYENRGVLRTYTYELFDQQPDRGKIEQEHNFGLVRFDGSPKPVWTAMRNLLQIASDPGSAFTPGTLQHRVDGPADLRQRLVQKRDGTFQLMLWRDVSVYDRRAERDLHVPAADVTVTLAKAAPTRVFRPSSSATPSALRAAASQVSVPVAGELVVLEIGAGGSTRPALVIGDIGRRWTALGGASSFLGLPLGPETDVAGGRQQLFEGGRIYWTPATGAHEVHGMVLGRYLALGGPAGVLGFPTSDEQAVAGGRMSTFARGRVYWSASTGAHDVYGMVLDRYLALGGSGGHLGLPVAGEAAAPGGRMSRFQGGDVYWSPATGAHAVGGAIRVAWLQRGGATSRLGLPTTDELPVPGGRRSTFVGGWITWNSSTGAITVTFR